MPELYLAVTLALPIVASALLALALCLSLLAACQRPGFGLGVIALAWFGEVVFGVEPVLRLGIFIHAADIPLTVVALATLARWAFARDVPRQQPAWLVIVGLLIVGTAWGLYVNGRAAGVQVRPDFYAVVAASYAMSWPPHADLPRRVVKLMLVLCGLTLALCAYRWLVTLLPIESLLPYGGAYNVDGPLRVVAANAALLLAQVLVLALFHGHQAMAVVRWLSPVLLAAVLVLQHRSVWLAAVAGLLVAAMVVRSQRAPLWQQLLLALAVAGTTAAPMVYSERLSDQLRSSAQRALAGSDTVADRFQNWRATLRQWAGDGPGAIAVGRVRGADARRAVEDEAGHSRIIEYQAHNHYVNTLTQMGVLGLAAYAWLMVSLGWKLIGRLRRGGEPSAIAGPFLILLAMQLTYFVAYGVEFLQYLMLGCAWSWAAGNHGDVARPARIEGDAWRRMTAWR